MASNSLLFLYFICIYLKSLAQSNSKFTFDMRVAHRTVVEFDPFECASASSNSMNRETHFIVHNSSNERTFCLFVTTIFILLCSEWRSIDFDVALNDRWLIVMMFVYWHLTWQTDYTVALATYCIRIMFKLGQSFFIDSRDLRRTMRLIWSLMVVPLSLSLFRKILMTNESNRRSEAQHIKKQLNCRLIDSVCVNIIYWDSKRPSLSLYLSPSHVWMYVCTTTMKRI